MKIISYNSIKEKPFLSRKETVYYLGLHPNTLDRAKIPYTKIGRRKLYSKQILDSWLVEHSKGATNEN